MRRRFHIPAGTRLVSARPAFDWDRHLAEARTAREKREQELAEQAKHYAQEEMAGE